ncbi:uncharacterized protein LOC124351109 [Daphnia pulicaria]|uniref:uncharacterized protein LOC124351109 n=1 Tax=Daphnia pulicaria TaxID=35523 RepID=UPI001EEB6F7E|nr:uncharacterized protein LOC124351109 [Daphnia pulicaria]
MKAEYESNYDRKVFVEQLLADSSHELNMLAKAKVFSLLEQVGISARSLESTALRSNAHTPSEYLSLMMSRVAKEQAPGYLTRLETLTELQNSLASNASVSASHMTTRSIPNQTHRLSKTDGATHKVNYGFTTSRHSHHGNNANDYRMVNTNTTCASIYSSGYHTRTSTGPSLNQYNNQSVMTRQGTAKCDSLQTLKTHGSHRGNKLNKWNSTIPRDNCWKENVTDKQAKVYKHEVPKGATKAANKFSALYDVQLQQFIEQSLKVSGKELATTQQEISGKIEIKSNAAAITGSADAGKDLNVHKIEQVKVNDVAEGRPPRTASTAADFIQNIFVTGGKQRKQRSDRNDRETHVGQTNLKLDRYESSSQSIPERHAKNGSDSSREERDETTNKDGERRCKASTDKDDTKQERNNDYGRSGMQRKESPSNPTIGEVFSSHGLLEKPGRLSEQVGINAGSLESTALRSNALTPSDYPSMMRSRVAEEQAPSYLTRLETLTELQNCLAADTSASASHKTARSIPNQTQHRSSNTGGASHRGNWGSKASQHSQHGTVDDYRMTSTNTAAVASNYSSGYNTRAASGSGLNQSNNQSAMTRRGTSDSKEGYSSDDNKDKKGFVAAVKGFLFNK